ncbi:hypothetical protein [Micromonospora sp. DT47]|uniref:hypothetical protein n=1 Tax=Micromonospora sp. DT47 TaxID=3393431 RepID=UPI003CE72C3E
MSEPHRCAVPRNVTDVLLWLLAADVAAQHSPHPDDPGRCCNLRCARETYPCPRARDAQRACHTASRPTLLARGRAQVIAPVATAATRFAGWFRPARAVPPTPTMMSAPRPPQRLPLTTPRAA